MIRIIRNYIYTILNYQPSLFDKETIPLAVIVLSASEKKLLVMGQEVSSEDITGIGKVVMKNLKSILEAEITDALAEAKKSKSADVEKKFFDILAENNKWNLYVQSPKKYEGENLEAVTFTLFQKNIGSKSKDKVRIRRVTVKNEPISVPYTERNRFDIEAKVPA